MAVARRLVYDDDSFAPLLLLSYAVDIYQFGVT
jgi:hypothetical protein